MSNHSAAYHAFEVGQMVQLKSGARMYIARLTRAHDGAPMYALAPTRYPQTSETPNWLNGYRECNVKLVKAETDANTSTGWAIFNRNDVPISSSVRSLRHDSISWFVGPSSSAETIKKGWGNYRKRGFTCRRVSVTELAND